MRFPVLAIAAALALNGCAAGNFLARHGGVSSPRNSEAYVASASANDLFEIQAAELAIAYAQRADVRAYAQRLIEEHSRATQHLADAAIEAGVSPPSAGLTAAQQRTLGALQAAAGGDFDELYLREQIPAHETAARLHHAYALAGDAEPLRRTAATAVARVLQHLNDARRLRRIAS